LEEERERERERERETVQAFWNQGRMDRDFSRYLKYPKKREIERRREGEIESKRERERGRQS
jgi:hypothetical protein